MLIINFFIIIPFSCNHFPSVKITGNSFHNNAGQKLKSSKRGIFKHYRLSAGTDKSYPVHAIKFNQFYYKRYFAIPFSFSPLTDINNKAVGLALDGRHAQAEILFSEILKEDADFPAACNNLGVIYELMNNNDNAFNMYSKACMMDLNNEFYRQNFLNFCDK